MRQLLEHKPNWLTRIFFFVVGLFVFQTSIAVISGHPIILEKSHPTNISKVYTYDEIGRSDWVESGHSRVNWLVSKVKTGYGYEVLKSNKRVAARTGTQSIKSLGAAARGFSKNSFKSVDAKFLSRNGINDIHNFKRGFLGKNAILKHFDVVKHTQTGELLIVRKTTQEVIEYTGTFVK